MLPDTHIDKLEKYARSLSDDPDSPMWAAIVLPNDEHEVLYGTNRMPGTVRKYTERRERPEKYKWIEHAERDAIYKAAAGGYDLFDSEIHVKAFPCVDCARAIIAVGIWKVFCGPKHVSDKDYGYDVVETMFKEEGVSVEIVEAYAAVAETADA